MTDKSDTTRLDWTKSAPAGGWKPRTYYVAEVKFKPSNPAHRSILYIGFWDDRRNEPGGYSAVFNGSYEGGRAYTAELYSVRVISEIEDMQNVE